MTAFRFLFVGVGGGLLFAVLDGLLNGNPLAGRVLAYLKPIARERIRIAAGVALDLLWGFAMAAIYLLVRSSLPGHALVKGICYGALAWFFRVAMGAAGESVILRVPGSATVYRLVTGAAEMLALGVFYGLVLI